MRPLAVPLRCLLLVLLVPAGLAQAEEGPAREPEVAQIAAAITRLEHPLAEVRRAAVERLVQALPAARAPVLAALPGAGPLARQHLNEVLRSALQGLNSVASGCVEQGHSEPHRIPRGLHRLPEQHETGADLTRKVDGTGPITLACPILGNL